MRLGAALLTFLAVPSLLAETFIVQSTLDDGSYGTLRWAIEQSNATPGWDRISLGMACSTSVLLQTPLPAVSDTADIGSDFCDLTIDARNVLGDGLTITGDSVFVMHVTVAQARRHGFAIAGKGVSIYSCRATNNADAGFLVGGSKAAIINSVSIRNGRGIVVEGTGSRIEENFVGVEDEQIAGNRGVGIHVTASAILNHIGRYEPPCHSLCAPPPAPNVVSGHSVGILVEGSDNEVENNFAHKNREDGIRVTAPRNVFERNDTSSNGASGLRVLAPSIVRYHGGACNAGRLIDGDGNEPVPELLSVVADGALSLLTIDGVLRGRPLETYEVHLVAETGQCPDSAKAVFPASFLQGWNSFIVTTDAAGEARFQRLRYSAGESVVAWSKRVHQQWQIPSNISAPTAIVKNDALSADLQVTSRADKAVASRGHDVTFSVLVKNNGPSATSFYLDLPRPRGTQYVNARILGAENSTCGLTGVCWLTLAAGGTLTVEHTVRATTATDGEIAHTASLRLFGSMPDPNPANNSFTTRIPIRAARSRTVRK